MSVVLLVSVEWECQMSVNAVCLGDLPHALVCYLLEGEKFPHIPDRHLIVNTCRHWGFGMHDVVVHGFGFKSL